MDFNTLVNLKNIYGQSISPYFNIQYDQIGALHYAIQNNCFVYALFKLVPIDFESLTGTELPDKIQLFFW